MLMLIRNPVITPLLFDIGIRNLVCGHILGSRNVPYYFGVTLTLTLTFGLNSRKIVSELFVVGIPKLVCSYILRPQSVTYCFRGTVTQTSGFNFGKVVSLA